MPSFCGHPELGAVKIDESFDAQRRSSGFRRDDLVGPRENAVLVVDRNCAEVLDEERRQALTFKSGFVFGDSRRAVAHCDPDRISDFLGDLGLRKLCRSIEWISLPGMPGWLFQHVSDEASLVFGGDWCVPALSVW